MGSPYDNEDNEDDEPLEQPGPDPNPDTEEEDELRRLEAMLSSLDPQPAGLVERVLFVIALHELDAEIEEMTSGNPPCIDDETPDP